jgi:hypothetical protein
LAAELWDHVDDLEAAVARGELVLDRICGPRFFERAAYNAHLLEQIADRDAKLAELLLAAEREDAYFDAIAREGRDEA